MRVKPFYTVNAVKRPKAPHVYHNNSECASGQDIRKSGYRKGTGGYELCQHCDDLNKR